MLTLLSALSTIALIRYLENWFAYRSDFAPLSYDPESPDTDEFVQPLTGGVNVAESPS